MNELQQIIRFLIKSGPKILGEANGLDNNSYFLALVFIYLIYLSHFFQKRNKKVCFLKGDLL